MIELPELPAPNSVSPALIDFGFVQRPALGARATRIERAGSRYSAQIGLPPMRADVARVFVSRLLRAKSEGLRIEFPLLEISQSPCGTPLVDGAGQAGKTLNIKGLTPHYAFREGYWLTLVDGFDGARYLHNCGTTVAAGADGRATIALAESLRAPFADGATILLAKPTIEGFVTGESWDWQIPVERLIALSVPIEEWG